MSSVQNEISGGVFLGPVIQGQDITVLPPPAAITSLNGLPPASPAFAGRSAELADLSAALSVEVAERTVLVTGAPGAGKTELALQAAHSARQAERFPGGVLFVDMLGYHQDSRLSVLQGLRSLLHALGVERRQLPDDEQDCVRLYRSLLAAHAERGKRLLVVVDNVSSVSQAEPFRPSDRANVLLLTSRHRLPSLGARSIDLDVLDPDSAVDLMRRAVSLRHSPGESRFDAEPAQARRLAELCDHLPLALHIVAGLLADAPTRPLSSVVGALADTWTRLGRLTLDDRAVRAAFTLSYRQLSDEQRRLFRLLPLHPGSEPTPEVAAALLGTDVHSAEGLLQELARAHMIEPAKVWGRWHMHDLLHLFARELLPADDGLADDGPADDDDDGRAPAQARLVDHYRPRLTAAVQQITSGSGAPHFADRGDALTWLEAEQTTILTLAATPAGRSDTEFEAEAARAQSLLNALYDPTPWDLALPTALVTTAQRIADRTAEISALLRMATVLYNRGRLEQSADAARQAAELARTTGSSEAQALALSELATALQSLRRTKDAVATRHRALAIAVRDGSRRAEARVLNELASDLRDLGDHDASQTARRRALQLAEAAGDRRTVQRARDLLAWDLMAGGRAGEAVELLRHALADHREAGEIPGELATLHTLARALDAVGRPQEAEEVRREYSMLLRRYEDALVQQLGVSPRAARNAVLRALVSPGLGPALHLGPAPTGQASHPDSDSDSDSSPTG